MPCGIRCHDSLQNAGQTVEQKARQVASEETNPPNPEEQLLLTTLFDSDFRFGDHFEGDLDLDGQRLSTHRSGSAAVGDPGHQTFLQDSDHGQLEAEAASSPIGQARNAIAGTSKAEGWIGSWLVVAARSPSSLGLHFAFGFWEASTMHVPILSIEKRMLVNQSFFMGICEPIVWRKIVCLIWAQSIQLLFDFDGSFVDEHFCWDLCFAWETFLSQLDGSMIFPTLFTCDS